jgi:signal transduction histidine kinase
MTKRAKEIARVDDSTTGKCWEMLECTEQKCPAYKSKDIMCWLLSGTHCRDEIQGKFLEKMELCLGCKVFKANMAPAAMEKTLNTMGSQLKAYRRMVEDRDKELEHMGGELALGLSETFESLRKIAAGDPSVRIPETSEIELIGRLKHLINVTAENIGEIVDQSHEFAMGLAEHFDVLHRVARGELEARVTGNSPVELLESLKNVTNRTIETISREMNERIQAEEKFRKLNEELEARIGRRTKKLLEAQEELVSKEKLAILGQLSGSVGHELRNPLGVINNAVYFLKTVMPDADETVKDYLEIIKGEVNNSLRIISDLLDFSRTKTPHTRSTTINELINKSLEHCTLTKGITMQIDIPAALPTVKVDPLQMKQVFQNLITNAIQAMPNGGTLEIKAIENKKTAAIKISFTDTGEGISAEDMKKLFQPLFSTKARGIGLGLVVSKSLTETNGGTIEIKSQPGRGTTFTVVLPAES